MLELVSFLEMHIICILISNALIFRRCSFHCDVVKEWRGCNSPPSDGRLCRQPYYLLSQSSRCLSLISQRRAVVLHVALRSTAPPSVRPQWFSAQVTPHMWATASCCKTECMCMWASVWGAPSNAVKWVLSLAQGPLSQEPNSPQANKRSSRGGGGGLVGPWHRSRVPVDKDEIHSRTKERRQCVC